ncbi:hypothetical protein [Streptomyces chrestomyceticus]|uniref:hypothetical protein n=1 Tax=Streptomyces chrestomyceticus TaxID=68185 RepID=UPI000F619D49|nr:hypothetical protein [Streptomyces chrestomyceticus]
MTDPSRPPGVPGQRLFGRLLVHSAVRETTEPFEPDLLIKAKLLMCDDLDATVAGLEAKGVEFTTAIAEQRWGRVTTLAVPGAGTIGLYQTKHETAYDLD